MIHSIRIRGLRGLREAELDQLAPLSILMGPSGAGKSTVLEALLIGVSADVGDAVGRCVLRRTELPFGARFLCSGTSAEPSERSAEINTTGDPFPGGRKIEVRWRPMRRPATHVSFVSVLATCQDTRWEWIVNFEESNRYACDSRLGVALAKTYARLLDQRFGVPRNPLHEIYSRARERGAAGPARELIRELVPELETIEILTPDGVPVLHLSFANRPSVPVSLSGDGMESAVRLALELCEQRSGLFLIEEPEAHQHIAAMQRSARVICGAVRAGAQVVLSTHSLEFLDLLLDEMGEERLHEMALFQLQLNDGVLASIRFAGEEISFARSTLEKDLR